LNHEGSNFINGLTHWWVHRDCEVEGTLGIVRSWTQGPCPWRVYFIPSNFLSQSLFSGHQEVNYFPLTHTSAIMYCLVSGPKTTRPNNHELKPLTP
jgi:hypothetical protein